MIELRRRSLSLLIVLMISIPAFADVLFLDNGEVILGVLLSAGDGNVVIRTLGQERRIDAGKIERTETGVAALKDVSLEIYLRDGTVIRGKILDYDEEIGVFVDISFGNLALPLSTIQRIQDPLKVPKANKEDILLGLSGVLELPISSTFGLSWGMAATAEFKLSPSARLYLGTDLLWNSLGYQPSDEVDYTLAGVRLYALYRFSGYWDGSVFGTIIIPYVKLGGGAVFVQARDGSAGAAVEFQGSMTSMASVQVGADFRLPAAFSLRVFIATDLVFQSGGAFFLPGAGIGLITRL